MTTIRVLIVDDHAVVRNGLRFFLLAAEGLELVGEASSGEEALTQCARLQPDVVLMDLMMPGMGGVAAIRAVREQNPETRVIALTSFEEEDLVQKALGAGASGYLLKNVAAEDLAKAIRAAQAGQSTLAPEVTQALVNALNQPRPAPLFDLTPREQEVLRLMVKGHSNAEMAHALTVSLSTIKFHVSSIFSKLHVDSRTEAVAIALQKRLVE